MKQKIFSTTDSWAILILRAGLGLLILPHGLQKAFGLFGGHGFTGTMEYFTDYIKLPWFLGLFIILIELVGSLSLIVGFATRFWSLAMIALMMGTIFTVHSPFGFFMNWGGNSGGEGYEYHLAIILLSLILFINGGGRSSLDSRIAKAMVEHRR
jgi:putative oxidoreductase